jgi:hypothetical protein
MRAGLMYFVAVFGAGFLLGPIRILWLVPRVGVRTAELFEIPVMILVSLLAARWMIRRFRLSPSASIRLRAGGLALTLLVAAELGLARLQGISVYEYASTRDPVSGTAYLIAIVLFGLMPMLVLRKPNLRAYSLIDRFIRRPDVAESHEIIVRAPADVVFEAAQNIDMQSIPIVRLIFRMREKMFRLPSPPREPKSLVEETLSLGWRILAYRPGRELVMGSVTQPWIGNVKFQGIPADEFAGFSTPDFVKIAWTLEAEPLAPSLTRFRTQTRVLATDEGARRKFRRYWRIVSPGIVLIRLVMNRAVRREAEARRPVASRKREAC